MSAPGAIHTPHVDANGLGTWVEMVSGVKLWIVVRSPTGDHIKLPFPGDHVNLPFPETDAGPFWSLNLLEDMTVSFVALEEGDSL